VVTLRISEKAKPGSGRPSGEEGKRYG
jgi:hypothetical protein